MKYNIAWLIKFVKSNSAALIILAIFIAISIVLNVYFGLEEIQQLSEWLNNRYLAAPILTALLFMAVYSLTTAISLPIASFLTVSAGFVFETGLGTAMVVLSATLGSVVPFLLVRYRLKDRVLKKYPSIGTKFLAKLEEDGASYLFSARVTPIVPFYVTNAISGLSSLSVSRYLIVTAVGIVPGTVVYVYAGSQLNRAIDMGSLVSTGSLLALMGLGLLSLLPLLLKKNKPKQKSSNESL